MSHSDFTGRPLLDIASYARRGPGRRDQLSRAEIEVIARTLRRTPEVVVKVLTRGRPPDLMAARRHIAYLHRWGELELETDDGQRLSGRGIEKALLEDWDLNLEEYRRRSDLDPRARSSSPKLIHKLLFSMPPGTPPGKVLEAVKNFAREEFALQHRYAMVLHTDEPHPHVHVVVKAMSEQGVRLHVRKATLRQWRSEFACHLRRLGVAANATERAVRGEVRLPLRDGLYRAAERGESTVLRNAEVAALISEGHRVASSKILATRALVDQGWRRVGAQLLDEGKAELAAQARQFLQQMAAPRSTITARLNALQRAMQRHGAPRSR